MRRGTRTQALGWVLAAFAVLLLVPTALVLLGLNVRHVDAGRVALTRPGRGDLAYAGCRAPDHQAAAR